MTQGKFVAYYRVSTRKQGKSGLGLEAQQQAVRTHLNGGNWELISEFTEIESGKRNARPKLAEAITECEAYGAKLLIAKLDRLARNVAFISDLREAGVEFIAVDMPNATKFTVHIMAAVAEQEADMIAERTRRAMATARARGTLLGRRDNAIAAHSSKGNIISADVRGQASAKRTKKLLPIIRKIQADGVASSLREIAAVLNARGVRTARGGDWSAVQVKRLLDRSA